MSQVYSTEPATTGRVVVETTHGPVDVNLWCKECPTTTRTFLQLCLDGYYDGMVFHRVLSDFLIQTGLTRDGSMADGTPASVMDGYLKQSTAVPSGGGSSMSSAGDPLGWDRKRLELNPRIRFNHRGQVAAAFPLEGGGGENDANEEEAAMLRYQFFVTLDEAPFLDAKHVVFGTIAGATMFNALRIGRTDADEQTGVPTDMKDCPPRIKSVRVDHHPFEDLVVTADRKIPWKDAKVGGETGKGRGGDGKMERRRKKRKGKRDLNVLSFGDEERDYDGTTGEDDGGGGSMLSSHDVLSKESKFLSSRVDVDVDKRIKEEIKRELEPENKVKDDNDDTRQNDGAKAASFSNGDIRETEESTREMHSIHESKETVKVEPKDGCDSSKEDRNQRSDKSARSKGVGAVEARRARYLRSGAGSSANKRERLKREGDTMAKLFAFKSKVIKTKGSKGDGGDYGASKQGTDDSLASRMAKRARQTEEEEDLRDRREEALAAAPGYSGQVNEEETGDDAGDWLGTKFKCGRHVDQDSRMAALDSIGDGRTDDDAVGGDGRRMDDYVVLDEKRSGGSRRDGRGSDGLRDGRGGRRERDRRDGSGKRGGRSRESSGHRRPRY